MTPREVSAMWQEIQERQKLINEVDDSVIDQMFNEVIDQNSPQALLNDRVDVSKVVGRGYGEYWKFQGRYRVVKGSRGSKKSYTTALWYIVYMMLIPNTNLLVIRKFMNTHKESTRATLIQAIQLLRVEHLWHIPKAEHTLTLKATGQQIHFRGMDDPLSITSIEVNKGFLNWVWWEEAYQIAHEDEFDKVDLSIRGIMPDSVFKQHTITFNPWNEKHWLKAKFFDEVDPTTGYSKDKDIMAITTTYRVNEYLDDHDRKVFQRMEESNPRRFDVEGNGNWGVAEGLVFDNWEEYGFDYRAIIKRSVNIYGRTDLQVRFGLDFGYTNDTTALVCVLVDEKNLELYIFDEYGRQGMTNKDISEMLKHKGYAKETIRADSSEPKSIDELKYWGIRRARPAQKGPGSVLAGIGRLRDYKMYVHPKCTQVLHELNSYIWDTDKKTGKTLNKPVDEDNHFMDALRYATEGIRSNSFRV